MKTAHDEKKEAEYIRYLRDCGYSQKSVAEAMEMHTTQVCRIAKRHDIQFGNHRREPPHSESGVYTLGLNMRQWQQIGADVRHWFDVLGDTYDAVNFVAQMYGIPVGAVECWIRGEEHLLD